MKARPRKSPATSRGFETRETLRTAVFSGHIRVFAATSDATVPVCEKMNRKFGTVPLGGQGI
jgi:hypothetical protein